MTRPLEGIHVVELTSVDDRTTTIVRNRIPIGSPGLALALASSVVFVVLTLIFTGGGDSADSTAAPVVRPGAVASSTAWETPPTNLTDPESTPAARSANGTVVLADRIEARHPVDDDRERGSSDGERPAAKPSGLGTAGGAAVTDPVAVRAIAASATGDRMVIDSRPDRPPRVVPLEGPHGEEELDVTGQWMAGLSLSRGGAHTLWVGPVDQPLAPVASRVLGFAWHDTDAGILGWTERDPNGRPAIVVLDVDAGTTPTAVLVEVEGPLQGFGDWGFAVTAPSDRDRVHLVGPGGGHGYTYAGAFAGGISKHHVLLARTEPMVGGGLVVSPDNGIGRRSERLDDGEYPARAQRSPSGWHAAVHVLVGGPKAWGDDNHVDVFTPAATSMRIPAMAQATPLAWSADGRHLAMVRHRAAGRPTIMVVDVITSTVIEHPPLPEGSVRVEWLAVLSEISS